jgi:hypothetical protein
MNRPLSSALFRLVQFSYTRAAEVQLGRNKLNKWNKYKYLLSSQVGR